VEVRIFLDGVEADRIVLSEDADARTVRLILARRANTPFVRIDLESAAPASPALNVEPTSSGGVLMVARPVIEP
jgi:hypothetical protein